MLKLTVLLRYNEKGRRVCDRLAVIYIEPYADGRRIIGSMPSKLFDIKYGDMKKIICDEFTSNKPIKDILKTIAENGMKPVETKFSETGNKEYVILIDD